MSLSQTTSNRRRRDSVAVASITILFVSAVLLSAASVPYELSAGGHGGASGSLPSAALAADALGVAVGVLAVVQVLLGYRLFSGRPISQVRAHAVLGWTVGAALAVHAAAGVYHSLQPPREPVQGWLVALGLVTALSVALQFALLPRGKAHHSRRLHVAMGPLVVVLMLFHVAAGTIHAVTG